MTKIKSVATAQMPFIDLHAQRRRLGGRVEAAIQRVVESGQYILGPEVNTLEGELAKRAGVAHCVACSSGTDALVMALMAAGIGAGDAVIVPAFTFVASAETVKLAGATPIFADVSADTFNIDAKSIAMGFAIATDLGLRPSAVIPVDLFGLPADYDAIDAVAREHGAIVIADAAQSFGASYHGRPVGSLAAYTTTSFYPSKPLGCYGDGGAVLTDDPVAAARLRSLAMHGMGEQRYCHDRIGLNGRMDTIQAAVLLEKITIFDEEIVARNRVAAGYTGALGNLVTVPRVAEDVESVWAQYTVRTANRDALAAALREKGIPTAIHYPIPLHRQDAYTDCPRASEALTVSEDLANTVISLPIHPYLSPDDQERVVEAIRAVLIASAA